MKTNHLIKTLLAALLLATAPSGTHAASLLADGTFDNLPVGTAPDRNTPAGRWFWPAYYIQTSSGSFSESFASQVTIVPAPGGGGGNALHYSFAASDPGPGTVLPNILAKRMTRVSGDILCVSFDIFVTPGRGGGDIFFSNGSLFLREFGPYLHWRDNGKLYFHNSEGFLALFDYPHGVWQTVQLKIDMARSRFDLEWSERGQPVTLTRTNMTFAGVPPYIDRIEIARGRVDDVNAYYDNIQVSAGPPVAVMPGQSIVAPGSSVTLRLTNTLSVPTTYQWQFHGTNLPGATSSNLALSNLTLDQSGPYSVIVSNEYEVVTATPANVQVVDRVTISSQPQGATATNGANVTLSVTAVSPLPITYQWQLNGVDLPGQTGSTLTLTNVQFAQDGLYTVVATDALRSVSSEPATLVVLVRPVIVQAPLSQSVVAGGSVTFSAEITGNPAPFLYQWRQGSTTLTNIVQTEKKAFLTLNNVRTNQAGLYRIIITNAASPTLSVNATWNRTVLPDSDGDGLPDAWETAHGLSAADAADAALDSDGDGQSNLGEYRSDTNPTNAMSCLKLEAVTQANGLATVTFNATSNQTYTVECCADLGGSAWSKLTDVIARPNNRTENVTDGTASDAARFYRVISPRRP